MSIANASQVRQGCEGFVIANASQNVARYRSSISNNHRTLVGAETSHHGVAYVTREQATE